MLNCFKNMENYKNEQGLRILKDLYDEIFAIITNNASNVYKKMIYENIAWRQWSVYMEDLGYIDLSW